MKKKRLKQAKTAALISGSLFAAVLILLIILLAMELGGKNSRTKNNETAPAAQTQEQDKAAQSGPDSEASGDEGTPVIGETVPASQEGLDLQGDAPENGESSRNEDSGRPSGFEHGNSFGDDFS